MRNFSIFISLLSIFPLNSSNSLFGKLMVVSYDGFRYDYLDLYKNITPNLNALKLSSSYAEGLLNVFPTQTFTNHFSIATGLYPEVHCVLGSNVYDKKSNKLLKYGYELFHYNDDILPIWVLNEKAAKGRHSGAMMWPGSNFEYNHINSTFIDKYDKSRPFEERVDTVMKWFKHPTTPANLAMLYFEEPDNTAHAFGPDSPQNLEQIKRVDILTKYILKSLDDNNLTDVNILFLSDHGMEAVREENIIDLNPVIGNISDIYGTSPVSQIYPKPGESTSNVFNKLKQMADHNRNFEVYLKSDIPDDLHYKHCGRSPPILAIAKPPYAFQDLYGLIEYFVKSRKAIKHDTYGVHGYKPSYVKMHPYFIAHGPLFKENYDAKTLRMVDLFSMFLYILKLEEPPIKPNGTLSSIDKIFKTSSGQKIIGFHVYIISGIGIGLIALIVMTACILQRRRYKKKELQINEEVEKLLESCET